jgi:hypothetical protein
MRRYQNEGVSRKARETALDYYHQAVKRYQAELEKETHPRRRSVIDSKIEMFNDFIDFNNKQLTKK